MLQMMQNAVAMCVVQELNMLILCFVNCIGYQFVSGSNSRWWLWLLMPHMTWGQVIWRTTSSHLYPSHQVWQERHAMGPKKGKPFLSWPLLYGTTFSLKYSWSQPCLSSKRTSKERFANKHRNSLLNGLTPVLWGVHYAEQVIQSYV